MTRPREAHRRGLAISSVAMTVALCLILSAAATPDEPTQGNELPDGPWTGSLTAAGTDTWSDSGASGHVRISSRGNLNFVVVDGTLSGTWSSTGTNVWEVGEASAASVEVTGLSTVVGAGSLTGGRTDFSATGTTSQEGELLITHSAGSVTREIANENRLSFALRVVSADCDVAHGVLSGSFVEGTFSAIRTSLLEPLSAEEAAVYVDGIGEWVERFNGFLIAGGIGWSELVTLLQDAEAILNELNNLSGCDVGLLGEGRVEQWQTVITRGVGEMIAAAATKPLSVDQVRMLVSAGLRVGAIGSGSIDPVSGAAAETALQGRLEGVLADNLGSGDVCPRGGTCLAVTEDTFTALMIASNMGWDLEIGGERRDPDALLEGFSDTGWEW